MIIGFTGTREGMTYEQKSRFAVEIAAYDQLTFVHGDCIGADEEAHEIAMKHTGCRIEIRGCNYPNMRAYCKGAAVTHQIASPLARNRVIVETCHRLIGCPRVAAWRDLKRGGSVYTIRFAIRFPRHTTVIAPNGQLEEFNTGGRRE